MARVILLNKPFDVLSQFTDAKSPTPRRTLSEFVAIKGVYPAGRLDRDSEGLLLLTDDGRLQAKLSNPSAQTGKTYLAQVEGLPDAAAMKGLREGVTLKDGRTRPAEVKPVDEPDWLWPRVPPIRVRKTVPDSWIELTITEGRNRQIRRMTAHVGHPTLRLIRIRIGPYELKNLAPGEWREA